MSDSLSAAASALGAPEALVKRSAEARAKASGVSVDDILAAWAGGGAVALAPAPSEAEESEPDPTSEAALAPEPMAPAPVPSRPDVPEVEEEVEDEDEAPAPLRVRVAAAGRVGMWTGAILGVVGFLAASPWTLPNASVLGEEGDFSPALLLDRNRMVLVTALFSVVFGAIVASVSRTATGWLVPGGRLGGRGRAATYLGAVAGAVLGLVAGSVLGSFGQAVENAPELIQLPVVAAILVVVTGGGLLGWVIAGLVQVLGVPEGTHDLDVRRVQSRLTGAIGVPLAGLVALALLVLPLALVLIESNHLASGGAAVLAIIASGSILAIASLSASKPGMKISRGEFLLALGGIAVVVMIIFAVMLERSPDAGHAEEGEATATEETVGETTTTAAP